MRILVADDETDILNLMDLQLAAEGYTVFTATDGLAAYGIFEKEQVDIAILDIMMPGMDGLTLLRKIREKSQIRLFSLRHAVMRWTKWRACRREQMIIW